jgi:hypothetical protein
VSSLARHDPAFLSIALSFSRWLASRSSVPNLSRENNGNRLRTLTDCRSASGWFPAEHKPQPDIFCSGPCFAIKRLPQDADCIRARSLAHVMAMEASGQRSG